MPPEIEHILVKWIQTEDLSENASDYSRTRVIAEKILRFDSVSSDCHGPNPEYIYLINQTLLE